MLSVRIDSGKPMTDLKVTSAIINDLIALQNSTLLDRKSESFEKSDEKRENEATSVDIDAGAERLAQSATPNETDDELVLSEEAASLLALNVRQQLEETPTSVAGESERTILSLFN
jgi:hypothetical protein